MGITEMSRAAAITSIDVTALRAMRFARLLVNELKHVAAHSCERHVDDDVLSMVPPCTMLNVICLSIIP